MPLREHLMDILEDPQNGEAWFAALAHEVPADVIGRFLDGGALTSEHSKAVLKFTSQFAHDMKTHRLVRRQNVAS